MEKFIKNDLKGGIAYDKATKVITVTKGDKGKIKTYIHQTLFEIEGGAFPEIWTNHIQFLEKKFYMYELTKGSEYDHIVNTFKKTSSHSIVKVEVIQNLFLWKSYLNGVEKLRTKNGSVNEKLLWHGTRNTTPDTIYNGSEGFDMKYSSGGMWGPALYFAVNSSYSVGYSHPHTSGTKGMFFALVNLGVEHPCASNGNLRQPPTGDSVKGHTGGSDVHMIYFNQ